MAAPNPLTNPTHGYNVFRPWSLKPAPCPQTCATPNIPLKDWYATYGANAWRLEEFQHYWGNATFDDAGTSEAMQFLLRLYVERHDPRYLPPLRRALSFVLDSQYPIGGWPQRWPRGRSGTAPGWPAPGPMPKP